MAKRLLSLVVAMLLVLSLAPVALASTDAALAAVTAEAISEEPLAFVTKNLTLANEGVTWTSSDPSVIATDGTVTRHPFEDKTVTLTAKISGAEPVVHTVTVLSQLKTVGHSDTFKVSDDVTSYVNVNGWSRNSTNMDLVPEKDAANNTVLTIHTAITSADGTLAATEQATGFFNAPLSTKFPNGVGTSGVYTIEFDHYPCATDSGYSMQFRNNGSASNHTARVNFRGGELAVFNYASNNQWYVYREALDSGKQLLYTGDRISKNPDHVKYQYNSTTGKFSLTYNDEVILENADSQVATTGDALTGIGFYLGHRNGGNLDLTFSVDNLVVYTEDELTADMIKSSTDQYKVDFFADKIDVDEITATPELVTENLNLAAALEKLDAMLEKLGGYELADYGVSLDWSSSNTDRITNAGVVDNTNLFAEDVTMMATVSCGEESIALTKTVTVGQPYTTLTGVAQLGDFNNKTIGNSVYSTTNSTTQVTTHYGTFVQDDEEHGIAAKVTNGGTIPFTAIYGKSNYTKRLLIEAELKFVEEAGYTSGNPTFTVYGQGGAEGTVLTFDFDNRTITAKRGSNSVRGQYLTKEKENVTYAMPASVQENEWFNVAIDYVAPSKGMQVYVNGVLLNEIPLEAYSAYSNNDCTNSTVRGWGAKAPANSSLYIDNVSIKIADNEDITKVDAALNAFKMVFLSDRHVASLSSVVGTFPAVGPADGTEDKNTTPTEVAQHAAYNPLKIKFEGGAALSYKINGVAATGIDANTLPRNATIEVTATSGNISKTITANINIGSAGVAAIRSTGGSLGTEFDSIHVIGDVVGKKVVVALVDDEGIIYQTKIVTIEAKEDGPDSEVVDGAYRFGMNGGSFWKGSDAIGKSLKIFILDENLKPCSMPYLYKVVSINGI